MDRVDPDLEYDIKLSRKMKNTSAYFDSFITYFFPVTFHRWREGAKLDVLERLKGREKEVAIEILKQNLHLSEKNSNIAKAAVFFGTHT